MSKNIRYVTARCGLGYVLLAAGDRGICQLRLGDDPAQLEVRFKAAWPQARPADAGDCLREWCNAFVAYLADQRAGCELPALPLELTGTPFQRRVWSALCAIPRGEVRTYSELAEEVDLPRGARAVAGACARNPVAVLVPCHRVVPRAGGTGGYRWARWRKRRLLAWEGGLPEERAASAGANESAVKEPLLVALQERISTSLVDR